MDFLFHAGKGADLSTTRSGSVGRRMSWVGDERSMQSAYNAASFCHNYNVDSILQFVSTKPDVAGQLRAYQLKKGTGEIDGVDFFSEKFTADQVLDYYNLKNDLMQQALNIVKAYMSASELGFVRNQWRNFMYPFFGKYGQFSIFKIFVDVADVCNASNKFFQEIRGGEYESDAVSYFISSPNISVDNKYTCGDADLDLLLN